MANVTIPENHWYELKRSANCFVPKAIRAILKSGLTNAAVHEAGKEVVRYGFSVQLVGKIMRLDPVTHEKAAQFVLAYEALRQEHSFMPDISERDIVAAVFGIPKLRSLMESDGLDVWGLAEKADVSSSTIEFALEGGRVPGGVVAALKNALPGSPPLQEFCSSAKRAARLTRSTQFTLDDLLLPVPEDVRKWP